MSQRTRVRRVRNRSFKRIRHGVASILGSFLAAQSARLTSTASARTCTFNSTTDVVSSTAHGFLTGKGPITFANSGGALPTGIVAATPYYPIRIDANSFKIATSRAAAAAGTALDFSSNGTGTTTAVYQTTAAALLERLRQRVNARTLGAVDDIDNL